MGDGWPHAGAKLRGGIQGGACARGPHPEGRLATSAASPRQIQMGSRDGRVPYQQDRLDEGVCEARAPSPGGGRCLTTDTNLLVPLRKPPVRLVRACTSTSSYEYLYKALYFQLIFA